MAKVSDPLEPSRVGRLVRDPGATHARETARAVAAATHRGSELRHLPLPPARAACRRKGDEGLGRLVGSRVVRCDGARDLVRGGVELSPLRGAISGAQGEVDLTAEGQHQACPSRPAPSGRPRGWGSTGTPLSRQELPGAFDKSGSLISTPGNSRLL